MAENNKYLELPKDKFSCVKINTNANEFSKLTQEELRQKLPASLTRWQSGGVRGVWAKVSIKHSILVPIFVEHGFEYHHAQPKYVMLKKWLAVSEPDALPPYANQYLGAGGFVINEQNQLLVVQERFSAAPQWKLPGGHADPGEDVGEAARREVLEETGVEAEFQGVVAFRHQHHYRFGCSDFYFICLMRPLTHHINKCEQEIAAAKWMDLEEYVQDEFVTAANRHFAQCYLDMVKQGKYMLISRPVQNYSRTGFNSVYSIEPVNSENQATTNVQKMDNT